MKRGVLRCLSTCLIAMALSAPSVAEKGVILLHGFLGNAGEMEALEEAAQAKGFRTANIEYETTEASIDEMAADVIPRAIDALAGVDEIHVITHSMGGILFRSYMEKNKGARFGRVVMLAPPNHGSEVAAELSQYTLYREFFGPAGTELANITLEPRKVGDYALGIIAGSSSVNPVLSPILPGRDDGWVALYSTPLAGMDDYIVVPTSHGFITKNESAIYETMRFLETGEFDHEAQLSGMLVTTDKLEESYERYFGRFFE